jgi:hypothetical protein
MTTLTIQASKNGEIVETPRSNSVLAVAQARMLLEAGWRVHIADATGRQFGPSELDELLPFDHLIASHSKCGDHLNPPPAATAS